MLTKKSKESREEGSSGNLQETTPSGVPTEVGMEETISILTTAPHEKIDFTGAHRKSEEKFFSKIDAVARSIHGPDDASENHDKYINGKSKSAQ